MMITRLLLEILKIPSPTYKEAEKNTFIANWLAENLPEFELIRTDDGLIAQAPNQGKKPHLALIGHSDVVPDHFEPYEKNHRIYGAGASDMQAGLAAFLVFLKENYVALKKKYVLSIVVYAREEGTKVVDNGLYGLIDQYPDYFNSIDLAIIGEPTNNTVQLGCTGSLHISVEILGKASHSARPWDGENALYQAIPFIQKVAAIKPVKHIVFGVDYYDVVQITDSHSEPGRTTLPGYWHANVNYRYAPVRTAKQAESEIIKQLKPLLPKKSTLDVLDNSPPGKVHKTALFKQVIENLGVPIKAKQAWTDVAQLSELGVSAINFGPGRTDQAHRPDEYVLVDDLTTYMTILKKMV